ncbi:MAG TPA: hypothetical protein DDZ41_05565, partial [Flavobacterium sp.]|nr:hypothetical protein [Flavobacterium sp.]
SEEYISNFEIIKEDFINYKELFGIEIRYNDLNEYDFPRILESVGSFKFNDFLSLKEKYHNLMKELNLSENSKNKVLKIQLDKIVEVASKYSNNDIVLKNIKEIEQLQNLLKKRISQENLNANKTFNDLTSNGTKYLLDIETYLSFTEKGKAGFLTKLTNSNFKQVSYLEQITINGKKCNNRVEILQLKLLIENLIIINNAFNLLKQCGFFILFDDNSNLQDKKQVLNDVIRRLEINKEAISQIQFDKDFINLSEYTKIDLFNVDDLSKRAIILIDDFNKLKVIDDELKIQNKLLSDIENMIQNSILKEDFGEFLPLNKISENEKYEKLKGKFNDVGKKIINELTFVNLDRYFKELLPGTYPVLYKIPIHFFTKENFEFAAANEFLKKNEFIDLQKCKEELTFINNKIFQVKCDVLFDLAKLNFKSKFDNNEIDAFINLLNSYKFDYSQSLKKGIKDNAKFQIAIRKKGSQISKTLSCWVMKFNDVSNSLEHKPEIFDCIIVDEASQLNFNSVLLGYYSENIIIVGDSKQTSPDASMVDSNSFNHIKDKFLKEFLKDDIIQIRPDTSLFDLAKMVAGRSDLLLREHFRCVPEIIEFSKREFYDNSLRPLKQINSNRLNPKETVFVNDAFIEDKIVYKEIGEIKKFLQRILKDEQYSNKSIGVVSLGLTKHTEKLKDIKEDLANEFGKQKIDKHKLIIEDSPKFQGDERDVMIVSLGVALDFHKLKENQNAKPRAIISDQDEFKKINVALSRAKEQMILFHSVEHNDLQTNDFRNKILSFFKDEAKPISQLQINNNNIERYRHNVPEPFDSWFEFDVAKALIENGYSYIEPRYKVKEDETFFNPRTNQESWVKFYIDLVVHNNG